MKYRIEEVQVEGHPALFYPQFKPCWWPFWEPCEGYSRMCFSTLGEAEEYVKDRLARKNKRVVIHEL